MPFSDGLSSSPAPPGPGATLEESLKFYKAQYEQLESELADFQASSKDLETELEKDIEASERRERQLKEKAANLQYEVDEWKTKYKQAKSEASHAQSALQKEITELRDTNRTLQLRLRDTEVANDDIERQQRHTESSLEDMESKYNQTLERSVMLEEEMRTGEQERESLRIEAQRLKDELSDLKIETDIVRNKLQKAQEAVMRRGKPLSLEPSAMSASPRSELSPATTDASFDTPPAKTASSSGVSDTPTPPSPPISEKSVPITKPFATPSLPKTRMSINANTTTPRQPTYSARTPAHNRGPSVPAISRTGPSSSFRQSISRSGVPPKPAGLPQSSSIMHLRSLRGKMQKLEERVQTARSKLPGPVNTPPKASPRSGSALGHHIPASVTVRSRKRTGGSNISGPGSLPDSDGTPSVSRSRPSRPSLSQQMPPPTPTRGDMAAPPPPRPGSRASMSSRTSSFAPGHSRPGSRASLSGFRAPLGSGVGSTFTPNASTDRVRPKSSLSNYDGAMEEDDRENGVGEHHDITTPTPRRTTFSKRTSDVGSAIPSPQKRTSFGGAAKLPGTARRQSQGFVRAADSAKDMRPPSRMLNDVEESYDMNETF